MKRSSKAQPLPDVAAIYARVSSAAQAKENTGSIKTDSISLPTQIDGCKHKAMELGIATDDRFIFIDIHTGEELYERPQMTALRDMAHQRQFSTVIVWTLDRLARDVVHQGVIWSEMEHLGITMIVAGEDIKNTLEGQLVRSVRGYSAQLENAMRVERSLRGKRERARRGILLIGNRPLYGYVFNADRTAYIIDPIKAAIVLRMFEEAAAGITLRRIASGLTLDGIPTPAGRSAIWDQSVICSMLKTPGYWGKHVVFRTQAEKIAPGDRPFYKTGSRRVATPDDHRITFPESVVPPIVSEELAMRVQERLRLNQQMSSRNNHQPWDTLLHGGFIKCGYCGKSMALNRRTNRQKPGEHKPLKSIYICRVVLRTKGGCEGPSITADLVDNVVWGKIRDVLMDPKVIALEVEKMKEGPDTGAAAATIEYIDTQIATSDRRLKRLAAMVADTDDPDGVIALREEIAKVGKQKRDHEEERIRAIAHYANASERKEGLMHLLEWCHEYTESMDSLNVEQQRNTLAMLGVQVKVYKVGHDPRMEMWLTLPLSGKILVPVSDDDVRFVLHSCSLTQHKTYTCLVLHFTWDRV